ncbi:MULTISPECIES: HNH endonuclease signature motif containing protein [Enterobacter]|uniref:HNH endonuclease signature motif containing protein n=1 Tax=Enterobacter TaxID=547 RepID=UPI0018C3319A|nr:MULTISPECIES: HNH endonuclease signature motif containing protein [Enterobacter]MBG0557279.1 HNH endonuclease [Enterobacter hormaechei]MDW3566758.1 HNH endonuclease [Enterobacter asburiae]WJW94011.1 HNH endonuclease signature motif containing protein [Enterobacter pseudoroggenkampii]
MAHTFYYGKRPERMIDLYNQKVTDPINDMESGMTAFWYHGFVRLRYPNGDWISLYLSSNFGRRDGFWCVLQSSNERWYSSNFLESALMGNIHLQAINEDSARDVCCGKLIPEVLEIFEMPASEKTKEAMAKQRIQQSKWATAVKALAGYKCQATGTQYALEACHIKPFSKCNDLEAWDVTNGICLTASVHTVYDAGLHEALSPEDPLTALISVEKLQKSRD